MRRVLVVAAHPDDDVLGCGATIARLAAEGAEVAVQFVADGVTSRADGAPQDVESRQADARAALSELGVSETRFGGLVDNALDTVPMLDIARLVSSSVSELEPDSVLTHALADLNIDHRITADAALVATRPQPGCSVRRLLHFEVLSATGWRPGSHTFDPRYFVDVSAFVDAKQRALHHYDLEMRPWPHARSYDAVEHLARWRGASVGLPAAEAFEVSRWIDD